MFFAGAVAVMDLRLLGGLAATAPAAFRARAGSDRGAGGMAVTGFMLFSAEASHVMLNPVFQLKVALIGAGLVNVALYESAPGGGRGSCAGRGDAAAGRTGLLSLGIWVAVAACGRSIAYF